MSWYSKAPTRCILQEFPCSTWTGGGKRTKWDKYSGEWYPESWISLCSGGCVSSSPVKLWETASSKNAQLQTDNRMGMTGHIQNIYATERGGRFILEIHKLSKHTTSLSNCISHGKAKLTQGRVWKVLVKEMWVTSTFHQCIWETILQYLSVSAA